MHLVYFSCYDFILREYPVQKHSEHFADMFYVTWINSVCFVENIICRSMNKVWFRLQFVLELFQEFSQFWRGVLVHVSDSLEVLWWAFYWSVHFLLCPKTCPRKPRCAHGQHLLEHGKNKARQGQKYQNAFFLSHLSFFNLDLGDALKI